MRPTVAVVGSGVSGLTAAYTLRTTHDVTLLEADDRFGGHAHTHTVPVEGEPDHRVDSGFIVHNDRTYPLLQQLFRDLDVAVHPTEMSMSIACDGCGLQYAGGRGGKGLFAQRRRVLDPRYIRMLLGVKRFQKLAIALLETPESADEPQTYGDFLRVHGFSEHFLRHYAIPVVACVWSSGTETALDYPARYLFTFLRHHGFLSIKGSPQWFTVQGGSNEYVRRLVERLADARSSSPVQSVSRTADGVEIRTGDGQVLTFDSVVIATHADDALALLTDATPDEKRVLGAFEYSHNETLLHTDGAQLPSAEQAKASWNFRMDACDADGAPVVTYWMNKLQGLESRQDFLVTLNAAESIDPETVIARMQYTHPIYTPASVAAQSE
ncbi:MAG: FAD-dependent oxidoreductase, partial [Actinomycetales bacterium]